MKTNYLLPYRFKRVGTVMFIIFVVFWILLNHFENVLPEVLVKVPALVYDGLSQYKWFGIVSNCIYDEIAMTGILVSLVFMALSKEKQEDEMIMHIRLQSMAWSIWVSSFIFLFGIIFIYELAFIYFTYFLFDLMLLIFVIRFNYQMYRLRTR